MRARIPPSDDPKAVPSIAPSTGRAQAVTGSVLCVIKKKLWVIAGAVAVSGVAVLPAITAQAHPADTPLAVGATHTGPANGNAYVIKVTHADPQCTVRVLIGSVKQNLAVDPDGTATTQPIDIGARPGTHVIYAKTIDGTGTCEHKETAFTKVVTGTYTLRTDKGGGQVFATLGEKTTIKALGWDSLSKSKVTIKIYDFDLDSGPDDPPVLPVKQTTRTPNKSGNVFWKVTMPYSTDFVVVATQGTGPDTKINSFILTVQ